MLEYWGFSASGNTSRLHREIRSSILLSSTSLKDMGMDKMIFENEYFITTPTGLETRPMDLKFRYDNGLIDGWDAFFGQPMIIGNPTIVETSNSITISAPPVFTVPEATPTFLILASLAVMFFRRMR